MIPILNQPIFFPLIGQLPSYDDCRPVEKILPCAKYQLDDEIYFQWRRAESPRNLACNILDVPEVIELIQDPEFNTPTGFGSWSPDIYFPNGGATTHGWTLNHSNNILGHSGGGSGGAATDMITTPVTLIAGQQYLLTIVIKNFSTIPGATGGAAGGASVFSGFLGSTYSIDGGFGNIYPDLTPPLLGAFPKTFQKILLAPVGVDQLLTMFTYGNITFKSISIKPYVTASICFNYGLGWNNDGLQITHTPGTAYPITYIGDKIVIGKDYRITIETNEFTTGTLMLKQDTINIGLITPSSGKFYFTAEKTNIIIIPSSDFDGQIKSYDIRELLIFEENQVALVGFNIVDPSAISGFLDLYLDLNNYISYNREWATLQFRPNDLLILAHCGYTLRFTALTTIDLKNNFIPLEDDISPVVYVSTCFEFVENADCHKLIIADCDCEAFEFNFENFKLVQRLPLIFSAPGYNIIKPSNPDSSGKHRNTYTERSKSYQIRLTESRDEVTHDCLVTQMICDRTTIEGFSVNLAGTEYAPRWDQAFEELVTDVAFNVNLVQDILYNRNCGCGSIEYILAGLNPDGISGFTSPRSWREIEHWRFGAISSITVSLTKILVNGENLLNGNVSKLFTLGVPALIISEGINNPGNYFTQNVSNWLNEYLNTDEIEFFDDLTVVRYRKGTTFEVDLTYTDNIQSYVFKYKYDNIGKHNVEGFASFTDFPYTEQ